MDGRRRKEDMCRALVREMWQARRGICHSTEIYTHSPTVQHEGKMIATEDGFLIFRL